MNIAQAINLAYEKLGMHPELDKWIVTSNRRKSAFGLCSYRRKEIQLSETLVPAMTDEAILDTIYHEIAHALTEGHKHNRVWSAKCIELGGNGQRCGGSHKYENGKVGKDMLMKNIAKYTLTCPDTNCGHISHMHRKPKRSFSCGQHGGGYNPKYKLEVTQNY